MTKAVYTPVSKIPLRELILPYYILRTLWRHRQLAFAFANRDFRATHRETYLGIVWTVLSPLIMLVLFTFVFGGIFKGRFNSTLQESPVDYALALFVGLSLFNMVGLMLNGSTGVLISNSVYVKSLRFPVEILPVAFVLNAFFNLLITLGLCVIITFFHKGTLPVTIVALPLLIAPLIMLCLGMAWFLSSSSVFIRDIPSITSPLTTILMFTSLVFFPLSSVSPRLAFIFKLNPLATLIENARGVMLYGVWPDLHLLLYVYVVAFIVLLLGYTVFMRTKSAFADVL